MFTQFGATAESLSKASTMVFRIGTDAHLYDDPDDVNIAPLLDSKFDSEKCEALKRLLALIAQGFDVSNFFPQVIYSNSRNSFCGNPIIINSTISVHFRANILCMTQFDHVNTSTLFRL